MIMTAINQIDLRLPERSRKSRYGMTAKRNIRIRSLAATVGLVSAVLAAPAAAQAASTDCPQESYCLWTDFNGNGTRYIFTDDQPNLEARNLNHSIRSVYN